MNTPRELEITVLPETPQWVHAIQEYRVSHEISPRIASNQTNEVQKVLKNFLFWACAGTASPVITLLIGQVILEQIGYPINPPPKTLEYSALGGFISGLMFELISQILKKALPEDFCQGASEHNATGDLENIEQPTLPIGRIMIQSFASNVTGVFIGLIILLKFSELEKTQDELIASCVGSGVVYGGIAVLNGLRR